MNDLACFLLSVLAALSMPNVNNGSAPHLHANAPGANMRRKEVMVTIHEACPHEAVAKLEKTLPTRDLEERARR